VRRLFSLLFGAAASSSPAPQRARRRFTEEELREPLEALAIWIAGDEPPPRPPDAADRVERIEARYGIRIPEDFRRYLLEVCTVAERMDGETTTWCGLDGVCSIPDDYDGEITDPAVAAEANAYLFFADYLIWCWAWAVCCSDGPNRGKVALIGGMPDGFVAGSFTEFVERYLRDPEGMATTFPPGAREA
jgi:hypothetical protein